MTTVLCPVSYADLRVGPTETLVWCSRCARHHEREFLRDRDETLCGCGHRLAAHGPRYDLAYTCPLSTCNCNQQKENHVRYRAKPVEIEALQFIADNNDRVQQILEWAGRPPVEAAGYNPDTNHFEYLKVHTLEGVMRADNGDYIIRGTAGEFYPCKAAIFEAKYEAVS